MEHFLTAFKLWVLRENIWSSISKILETLILDFFESNNTLGETQAALPKDRRIEDQIFSRRTQSLKAVKKCSIPH
jgi:hypothetical protein